MHGERSVDDRHQHHVAAELVKIVTNFKRNTSYLYIYSLNTELSVAV